jgi:pantothenate kinase type III
MLLTIDAGNTQTVVGLFRGHELLDTWRIATVADRTSDELALMVQQFLGFHGFSFALPGIEGADAANRSDAQLITGVASCAR